MLPRFDKAESSANEDRNKGLVDMATKIGASVGISALTFLGYRFAEAILKRMQPVEKPVPRAEAHNLTELRSEQEELWNVVAGIHATQKAHTLAIEDLRKELADAMQATTALAAHEDEMRALAKDMSRLKIEVQSLDPALQEDIKKMQDALSEEVQRMAQEIDRMKDDHARALNEHHELIMSRLATFKKDLTKVISKRPQ